MRYRSVLARRDEGMEIAMTPMIDVVFMLLIFFVWTASFQVVELILPSSLVSEQADSGNTEIMPEMEDLERIVVRIGWDGAKPVWTVNEVPIPVFAAVQQRLVTVAKIRSNLPVLVDPDALVPLGNVIDVYDAARAAGFANVQFAIPANAG